MHHPQDLVVGLALRQRARQAVVQRLGLKEQAAGGLLVAGSVQRHAMAHVLRCHGSHQRIQRAAGLACVARYLGHALLVAVQLLEHDQRQEDVMLLEAEQAHRVVHQHIGIQHEQAAHFGRAAGRFLARRCRAGCSSWGSGNRFGGNGPGSHSRRGLGLGGRCRYRFGRSTATCRCRSRNGSGGIQRRRDRRSLARSACAAATRGRALGWCGTDTGVGNGDRTRRQRVGSRFTGFGLAGAGGGSLGQKCGIQLGGALLGSGWQWHV